MARSREVHGAASGPRRRTLAWILSGGIAVAVSFPALAEYHCWPGTPIPAGNTEFTINDPGCYFLTGNRTAAAGGAVITISANNVYLDGRGRWLKALAGVPNVIRCVNVQDVDIVNTKLSGATGGVGVFYSSVTSSHLNVSDLVIADDGTNGVPDTGIWITSALGGVLHHVVIARNMIDVVRKGIVLENVVGSRVEDNVVAGKPAPAVPSVGIELSGGEGNDVRGNTVSNIAGSSPGPGAGIRLNGGTRYNTVQHSTIRGCQHGILLESATCNNLDWNACQGNLIDGIEFTPASTNNGYSFNRASAVCNPAGIVDNGVGNVNRFLNGNPTNW